MKGSIPASAPGSVGEAWPVGAAFGVIWVAKGVETMWAMAVAAPEIVVRVGCGVAVWSLVGAFISVVLVAVKVVVWLASLINSF